MTTSRPSLEDLAAVFRDAWHDADRENRTGQRVTDGLRAVLAVTDSARTLVLTGPDNLVAHIEGLQATLTKRNERIRQLEEQLAEAVNGEPTQAALKKAYRQGYQTASARTMEAISTAQKALLDARRPAFDAYLDGDKVDRPVPATAEPILTSDPTTVDPYGRNDESALA